MSSNDTSSQISAAPRKVHATAAQILPSVRTVVVRIDGQGEALEVQSPDGRMELRIALTDQGPVLSLRGLRLEIDAADTVAVNCRQFSLRTTDGMALEAGGDLSLRSQQEMHLRSAGDTSIDGKLLKLNCQDRTEYGEPALPPSPTPSEPEA
jgi:hypothetical protein